MQGVPPEVQQFISGVIDTDGCIQFRDGHLGREKPFPQVCIEQAHEAGEPAELVYIQRFCGGDIIEVTPKPQPRGRRRLWRLAITRLHEVEYVIRMHVRYGVMKKPQAEVVLLYLENDRLCGQECHRLITEMKQIYHLVKIDLDRLTFAYLSGVFAGDGCVDMKKNPPTFSVRARIARRSCIPFLEAIRTKVGAGQIEAATNFALYGRQAAAFLENIRPYLQGQKVAQVDMALAFHKTQRFGNRRTKAEKRKMLDTVECIKRLKKT